MTEDHGSTFTGFQPAATRFLNELAANQNREWFTGHKAEHEAFVKAPMGALLLAVTAVVRRSARVGWTALEAR